MVHIETQWPERKSRQIPETEANTIRECQNTCPEIIVVRQYVDKILEAELLNWVAMRQYVDKMLRAGLP